MSSEDSETNSTIVTISELINNAFGDPESNTVHHKHIQTVLYILARQLRILERRVTVQLTPRQIQEQRSSSSISVTEVKLKAMESDTSTTQTATKTKTQRLPKSKKQGISEIISSQSPEDMTMTSSSGKAKTSKYDTSKSSAADKTTFDKPTTYEQKSTTDGDASMAAKKSTMVKASSDKSSATGQKFTADDDVSMADKSFTTDQKSTAEDASMAAKSSTMDKVPSDKHATNADQKSSADKDTSKFGKKSTAADDTSILDTKSTPDKTSKLSKISGAGKKAEEEIFTDKTSVRDRSSIDTISSDKKLSLDKSGKIIGAQGRKATATAITRTIDPQGYQRLLDEVEESRERELRVIRQRVDSRDQPEKTPTPIASMDSFEAAYEKLLVVERVTAEEAKARAARGRAGEDTVSRLSVVTREQFQELVSKVNNIQEKLGPIGGPAFPENAELMQELRKGASLTDAMAALQLSARLEATEKTLTNLLSLVTDLASQTPGYAPTGVADDIQVIFGASDEKRGADKMKLTSARASKIQSRTQKLSEANLSPTNSDEIMVPPMISRSVVNALDVNLEKIEDIITYQILEYELQLVFDKIMQQVIEKTTQSTTTAENAMKIVTKLEKKIDDSINLGNRMEELENLVSNYSEQINVLDTGLSSQLTNYQEDLTQMQHDLETGLETMAEVLANTGGDVTAVAELNAHFSDLQIDIDNTTQKQRELRKIQNSLSIDLDGLRIQIEMLRDTKSDRDEVVDALRDKAGIADLNGLISHDQFDAVCGDIEKSIAVAYDKFNNQELVWQKAIDDLLRELNEKADIIKVDSLRDQINYHLEMLRQRIKFIADIVGEPTAAALARKISRGAACLSCATPAHMKTEESSMPVLPAVRPPAIGAEASKPKEHGDGLCYPGYPVQHPVDPRAHVCNRWCGGSHTLINKAITRAPPDVIITPFNRKVGQVKGTDGKMYAVDEMVPKTPCSQCLIPDAPRASIDKVEILEEEGPSNDAPFDWPPISSMLQSDVTPPLDSFQDN